MVLPKGTSCVEPVSPSIIFGQAQQVACHVFTLCSLEWFGKKKFFPLQSDIGSDRTAVHFLNFSTSYDHIFHEPAFKPVLDSYQTR